MKRRSFGLRRRSIPNPFTPQWSGVFENWSRKWVHKHYWRVRHIVDSPDDAMQECGVIFAKCYDRYVRNGIVNNPAWFMALYSRSVMNTWNSMSRRDESEREVVVTSTTYAISESEERNLEQELKSYTDYNHGPLNIALQQFSEEATVVLTTIMNAPMELIDFIFSGNKHRGVYNRRLLCLSHLPHSNAHVLDEIADLAKEK